MKKFFALLGKKETWKWFFFSFIWVIPTFVILDLATKWIFNSTLTLNAFPGTQVIPNFFYLMLQYNTGASWSLLANLGVWGRIILLAISLIMSGVLLYFFIAKFKTLNIVYRIGLTLMTAGAMGNLIDRALYWEAIVGHDGVIDFLSFHLWYFNFVDKVWTYYLFPTFNVADSCLTVGAGVLLTIVIIDLIKDAIRKNKEGEFSISPKDRAAMEKANETEAPKAEEKVEEEVPQESVDKKDEKKNENN